MKRFYQALLIATIIALLIYIVSTAKILNKFSLLESEDEPYSKLRDSNPSTLISSYSRSEIKGHSTSEHLTYLPIVSMDANKFSCSQSSFGTMLVKGQEGDRVTTASVLISVNELIGVKGHVATGAPSALVRDEWFGRLSGWKRIFLRGTFDQLQPIYDSAKIFDMEDMYECIGYGPESVHQAGQEALEPMHWVPKAEETAEETGKCLVYGPSVQDYEKMSTPAGGRHSDPELLSNLIKNVAPHVDIWMIQLAKQQRWVDGGRDDSGDLYSLDDLTRWLGDWVSWIKEGNNSTEVWVQLGIGKFDPLLKVCLPPQPSSYILEYRKALTQAGIDGIFVMPAQSCTPCPPSAPSDFPCSDDPQDHEYYLQTLEALKDAINLACNDS